MKIVKAHEAAIETQDTLNLLSLLMDSTDILFFNEMSDPGAEEMALRLHDRLKLGTLLRQAFYSVKRVNLCLTEVCNGD